MSREYQISKEVKEAREFWRIVKEEYNLGLNNYFRGREDKKLEENLSNIFDENSTDRRLKLGGE